VNLLEPAPDATAFPGMTFVLHSLRGESKTFFKGPFLKRRQVMPANALVMVVDDDAKIRRLIKAVLSRAGYDVVEAADGEEALDLLDHTPPDLIVMDVVMPKMDGRRLAEEVRKRDAILPLIVVTGLESVDNAVEMMRNGVYDFIAKPFTAERLAASVKKALEGGRFRRDGLDGQPCERPADTRCRRRNPGRRETLERNEE
jgi:DNA-binding NtrC family response regulator